MSCPKDHIGDVVPGQLIGGLSSFLLKSGLVTFLASLFFLFSSCEYQTNEQIFGHQAENCIEGEVSFLADVVPILQVNCNNTVCHGGSFPQGRVFLTTYNGVADVAADGRLVGSLFHQPGLVPMPLDQDKLDACSLEKIVSWVEAGFPDN